MCPGFSPALGQALDGDAGAAVVSCPLSIPGPAPEVRDTGRPSTCAHCSQVPRENRKPRRMRGSPSPRHRVPNTSHLPGRVDGVWQLPPGWTGHQCPYLYHHTALKGSHGHCSSQDLTLLAGCWARSLAPCGVPGRKGRTSGVGWGRGQLCPQRGQEAGPLPHWLTLCSPWRGTRAAVKCRRGQDSFTSHSGPHLVQQRLQA